PPPTLPSPRPATSCGCRWGSRRATIWSPTSRRRSSGRRWRRAPSAVSGLAFTHPGRRAVCCNARPDTVLSSLFPLDLHFGGAERAIGVYLLDCPEGPLLFDCGPSSTLPRLKEGLRECGVELAEVRHLLLSHIHLDHAGAAGAIVREHPE